MKVIYLLLSIFVAGCTTCEVPLGNYSSSTNSEYEFSLDVKEKEFSIEHQSWPPGNYENRNINVEKGTWSCSDNSVKFSSGGVVHSAMYQAIGINPFGLPVDTKALVFEAKEDSVLSKEILYPSSVLN